RIASADRSWPLTVTSGRSRACSNVVDVSRPMTRSPSPRLNTISAMDPYRLTGRMRSTSVTVTVGPSADVTVTGRTGTGGGASGTMASSTRAVTGPQEPGTGDAPAAGEALGSESEGTGPPGAKAMGTNTSALRSSDRV